MNNNKKNEGENYFFVSFFIQFGDLAKQSWLGRCHWKVYVKINCKSSWKWLVVEPKYATNHLSMTEEKKIAKFIWLDAKLSKPTWHLTFKVIFSQTPTMYTSFCVFLCLSTVLPEQIFMYENWADSFGNF